MLTIGKGTKNLEMNLDLFNILKKELKIDTKNLTLIEDDNLKNKRLENFSEMIELLGQDKFNLFYQSLDDGQKNILNQNEYYNFLSSTLNYQSGAVINSGKLSYLALKSSNVDKLIADDNFVAQFPFNNIIQILSTQSILMHNSEEIDKLRAQELRPDHDIRRQEVLKNIAIASLVNENLHEKSLDILKDIPPHNFTAEDKKTVQLSIDFLSASIILASTDKKDEEAISQLDLLEKVLKVYEDKFRDPEHNIEVKIPENIKMALEEKSKFMNGVVAIHNQEKLSPKEFGGLPLLAPVLEKDSLQLVLKELILSSLEERPSAIPAHGQVDRTAVGVVR